MLTETGISTPYPPRRPKARKQRVEKSVEKEMAQFDDHPPPLMAMPRKTKTSFKLRLSIESDGDE